VRAITTPTPHAHRDDDDHHDEGADLFNGEPVAKAE
jgi:hypothetical protein